MKLVAGTSTRISWSEGMDREPINAGSQLSERQSRIHRRLALIGPALRRSTATHAAS